MRLARIILAVGLLAVPATALAQSSPSPNNQSGPGVSPTAPSPTDPGAGAVSGDTKARPARPTMSGSSDSMGDGTPNRMTPGAAMRDTQRKNASPASGAEGVEKEK